MDVKFALLWQDMVDHLISMTLVGKAEVIIVIEEAPAMVMVIEIDEIGVAEIEGDLLEDHDDHIQGLAPDRKIDAQEV